MNVTDKPGSGHIPPAPAEGSILIETKADTERATLDFTIRHLDGETVAVAAHALCAAMIRLGGKGCALPYLVENNLAVPGRGRPFTMTVRIEATHGAVIEAALASYHRNGIAGIVTRAVAVLDPQGPIAKLVRA